MSWLIWQLAAGRAFFAGVVLLILCVCLRPGSARRMYRFATTLGVVLAVTLIAISATALPMGLYVFWALATLCWLLIGERPFVKWLPAVARGVLLCVSVAAVAIELSWELRPSMTGSSFSRVYVIGDSISAGLGSKAIEPWPQILHAQHNIDVVSLARAGAGAGDALRLLRRSPIGAGMVILEIGGNDVIGRGDPRQFERNLNALGGILESPDRKLVMLELPLLPFGNSYGRAQRRIADRYHMALVPRRYFAGLLSTPGATIDGVHLSAEGQQLMAAMIWDLIGASMQSKAEGELLSSGQTADEAQIDLVVEDAKTRYYRGLSTNAIGVSITAEPPSCGA